MSLWNSIKGWMDSPAKSVETEPAPLQPAGESARVIKGESIEEIFIQICTDNQLRIRVARKSGLVDAFLQWYSGADNREAILSSLDDFKEQVDVAKQKIGDWE